jgi:hypothetical protein
MAFGALAALSAGAVYIVPRHERDLVAVERRLGEEIKRRSDAEARAVASEVAAIHWQVEADRIRRAFFDSRNSWHIPPAAESPDAIPAAGVWVPTRK